jgi:hypothetical protein
VSQLMQNIYMYIVQQMNWLLCIRERAKCNLGNIRQLPTRLIYCSRSLASQSIDNDHLMVQAQRMLCDPNITVHYSNVGNIIRLTLSFYIRVKSCSQRCVGVYDRLAFTRCACGTWYIVSDTGANVTSVITYPECV